MDSQERLLKSLKSRNVLNDPLIEEAFRKIDRADFILPETRRLCYDDHPLPIPGGQTISQPYTVAFMLDLLNAKRGQQILDIGSGSGWTTALLAHITGADGSVTGLERQAELVDFGRNNLKRYSFEQTRIFPAGPELGLPGQCFDRILVSAAAPAFPRELTGQLKEGGILVIPVSHSIWKITKKEGKILRKTYFGFSFVPLIL